MFDKIYDIVKDLPRKLEQNNCRQAYNKLKTIGVMSWHYVCEDVTHEIVETIENNKDGIKCHEDILRILLEFPKALDDQCFFEQAEALKNIESNMWWHICTSMKNEIIRAIALIAKETAFNVEQNVKDLSKKHAAAANQIGGTHYKGFAIEPVEFIVKNNLGFREGNVIKYVCRHDKKNGKEDVKKSIHYLLMILGDYLGDDEKIRDMQMILEDY